MVLASTVASSATPIDCTTLRVALVSDEPRGTSLSGTTDSAVTSVVCTVSPSAMPRSASRNMIH